MSNNIWSGQTKIREWKTTLGHTDGHLYRGTDGQGKKNNFP